MPFIPKITKGPAASYTHRLDFSGWSQLQGDDGDTLSSATASVDPSGLTIGSVTVDADTDEVLLPLSGGTEGVTYRITVLATTSASDVLDGYLDVLVTAETDAGAVVYPSRLLPYFDTRRAMSLLYDEGELADNAATPSADEIDGNERAFYLCQAAWRAVIQAATRGKLYSVAELTDLANDPVRGADLIELVANLFWCRLLKRRRYVTGEPQAKDATCEEAEERLQLLRSGERIFNLEGVTNSTTGGTYENVLGTSSALSVGRFGSSDRQRPDRRFWACVTDDPKETLLGGSGADSTP